MKLIFFAVAAFLASCAAMNGVAQKATDSRILSGVLPENTSTEDLEDQLTRSDKNWQHFYVEATLYTRGLFESRERDKGRRSLDSEAEIQKRVKERVKLFEGETCFGFKLRAGTIGLGYFKLYRAKLEDAQGKLSELKFLGTKGVDSVPSYAKDFNHAGFDWFNSTVACGKKIDPSKGFKIHFMRPQAEGALAVLTWDTTEQTQPYR